MKNNNRKLISISDARSRGLKQYFTGEPCKYGHIDYRYVCTGNCVLCNRLRARKLRRENKKASQEYHKEYNKRYYQKNKEETLKRTNKYRRDNREMYARNKRLRWKEDVGFRVVQLLRNRVYLVLKRNTKSVPTMELVGCTIDFLKKHLQSTAILNGYKNFDINNYSGKEYHIDHIIPCASFNMEDIGQQRLCFNWSNLQILDRIQNCRKGTKYAP